MRCPRQFARGTIALACLATASSMLAACGETAQADAVAVDSTLVSVLVDLHLAEARGRVAGDPALGDSLRDLVFATHGTDSAQLDARLGALTREPGAAAALTEAVESQLSTELHGTFSP